MSRQAPWGRARKLPPQVVEIFREDLGYAQRGEPEDAMTAVQFAHGGGVLNPAVEHIGDLTNRMSKDLEWDHSGYGTVGEKVDKALRWLKHPYGFAREHVENMKGNARYHGHSFTEHRARVRKNLKRYVEAHKKLPVFNKAQWHARQAAVTLGEDAMDANAATSFERTIRHLEWLKRQLDQGEQHWWDVATQYVLGPNGKPMVIVNGFQEHS